MRPRRPSEGDFGGEKRRQSNRKYQIASYGLTQEHFNRLPDVQQRVYGRCHEPFEQDSLSTWTRTAGRPLVPGVDGYALRKGTILVDIETRRPVDMRPERSAESFRAWLDAHPGVEIICRARGGC